MITQKTATEIALSYREIETAEKLLTEISDALSKRTAPDLRDVFGRQHDGLQLGVPNGNSGHRLFNVPWSLAKPIIETHIAHHRAVIRTLSEKARTETVVNLKPEAANR